MTQEHGTTAAHADEGWASGSDHQPDIDWVAAERSPEFRELVKKKNSFVIPATIFFLAWYFGFIVLAGYAPDFMGERITGGDPDLFWSLSFALHRRAWLRVGGFCEEYVGYGGEDTDFGRSVVSAGLELAWTGSARAYHQHHEVEDPPVRHLDDILRNAAIFHRRWGRWPMGGWLHEFERQGLITRVARTSWRRR